MSSYKFCNNCMGCCIHAKVDEKKKKVEYRDNEGNVWMTDYEFDGYHHYCDKNPEGFNKWHETHKHDTYNTYKEFPLDCYEPTETTILMQEMIDLANEILNN